MVFFALTRNGYEDFKRHLGAQTNVDLWVNKDILTASELMELRDAGLSVTNFVKTIDAFDEAELNEAIDTIKEHHTSDCIWIER